MEFQGFILWLSYKENPLLGKIFFSVFLSCNRNSLSRQQGFFFFLFKSSLNKQFHVEFHLFASLMILKALIAKVLL